MKVRIYHNFCISINYTRKRKAPRIDLWGTPDVWIISLTHQNRISDQSIYLFMVVSVTSPGKLHMSRTAETLT